MGVLFPTVGTDLFAEHHSAGTGFSYDSIEIGTLAAASVVDAALDDTMLQDTAPVVITGAMPSNSGPTVQFDISIVSASALEITEIGFFSGDTLVIYWATANTVIASKAANTNSLISLSYTLGQDGAPGTPTLTVAANPLATMAQATAGTSNATLMTPLRTEQFWAAHVLTGTTAPGSADGIDGNVYLQTGVATGIFIKLAGVWVSVAGLLNVATTAQVNAGVINDAATTPLGLKNSQIPRGLHQRRCAHLYGRG